MQYRSGMRFAAVIVLAMSALSAACASKSINSLLADPSRYRSHEVTVHGTVVESFSVVNRGAYKVDDSTGQLWVVSDGGVPQKGARISVTGTLREGVNLGSLGELIKLPLESRLLLVESSHKARD